MCTKLLNSLTLDQRAELVNDMRDWVKDCQWGEEYEESEVDAMSDQQLIEGINRHYLGGIDAFIVDSDIIQQQAPPHGSLYGEPCGDRH